MKTNKQWAAALCMIAMAGCASDRMGSDTSNSGYSSSSGAGSSGMSSSGSSSTGGTASTSSTGSGTAAGSSPSTSMTGTAGAQTSYGVVQAIDQMQRQDVGVGAIGAAAAGGSTGMPSDKVYRVTVRLDDGSNQMVVVDSMPSYRIGDRVRYSDGSLVAY